MDANANTCTHSRHPPTVHARMYTLCTRMHNTHTHMQVCVHIYTNPCTHSTNTHIYTCMHAYYNVCKCNIFMTYTYYTVHAFIMCTYYVARTHYTSMYMCTQQNTHAQSNHAHVHTWYICDTFITHTHLVCTCTAHMHTGTCVHSTHMFSTLIHMVCVCI